MKKFLILTCLFVSTIAPSIASEFTSFPKHYDEKTPIFFMLHGCKQNEIDFIKDSFLLEKGRDRAIFYAPRQSRIKNYDGCWNWFLPTNQVAYPLSETALTMRNLLKFVSRYKLKRNPIYLVGFSAGAAQAMNFLACYPKYFAGIAAHSGLAYRVSDRVYDINRILVNGPEKTFMELMEDFGSCAGKLSSFDHKHMLFFHGTIDRRVTLKNFHALESQITLFYDYRDDKSLNNSVGMIKKKNIFSEGEKYKIERGTYEIKNSSVSLEFYRVFGMAHDWGGGPYRVKRNDPLGPETSDIILDRFGQR